MSEKTGDCTHIHACSHINIHTQTLRPRLAYQTSLCRPHPPEPFLSGRLLLQPLLGPVCVPGHALPAFLDVFVFRIKRFSYAVLWNGRCVPGVFGNGIFAADAFFNPQVNLFLFQFVMKNILWYISRNFEYKTNFSVGLFSKLTKTCFAVWIALHLNC